MIKGFLEAFTALTSPAVSTQEFEKCKPSKLLLCAELMLTHEGGVFETEVNSHCRTTSGRNLINTLEHKLHTEFSRVQMVDPNLEENRTCYAALSDDAKSLLHLFCYQERERLRAINLESEESDSMSCGLEDWK